MFENKNLLFRDAAATTQYHATTADDNPPPAGLRQGKDQEPKTRPRFGWNMFPPASPDGVTSQPRFGRNAPPAGPDGVTSQPRFGRNAPPASPDDGVTSQPKFGRNAPPAGPDGVTSLPLMREREERPPGQTERDFADPYFW